MNKLIAIITPLIAANMAFADIDRESSNQMRSILASVSSNAEFIQEQVFPDIDEVDDLNSTAARFDRILSSRSVRISDVTEAFAKFEEQYLITRVEMHSLWESDASKVKLLDAWENIVFLNAELADYVAYISFEDEDPIYEPDPIPVEPVVDTRERRARFGITWASAREGIEGHDDGKKIRLSSEFQNKPVYAIRLTNVEAPTRVRYKRIAVNVHTDQDTTKRILIESRSGRVHPGQSVEYVLPGRKGYFVESVEFYIDHKSLNTKLEVEYGADYGEGRTSRNRDRNDNGRRDNTDRRDSDRPERPNRPVRRALNQLRAAN